MMVKHVNWVAVLPDCVTYEFETMNEVWNDEAGCDCSLFRLFLFPDSPAEIAAASDQDYDVNEILTHQFNVGEVVQACEAVHNDVPDVTEFLTYAYEG